MRWLPLTILLAAPLIGACNNDNFANRGTVVAGARFQFIIDSSQSPAVRLLLDSATGDLWQLRAESDGGGRWTRLARGPDDARLLSAQEALGMSRAPTPTP